MFYQRSRRTIKAMKVSVLQENLSKALVLVSRSVASKAQLPVLNNVLIATDKGRLKLSATNLETGINFWLGAKIEKDGAISIPAKILTEFVSSLPAERVDLEAKENTLSINCGSFKANFMGISAGEFPAVPTLKDKETVLLSSTDLLKSVSQVAFAAAQDEGRPVLTGVLLTIREGKLVLAATDGYRLSFKKMEETKGIEEVKEFKKGLIIPGRTLVEVTKIITNQDQERGIGLTITSNSNQVIFSSNEAEVVSRLIEGSFPEFEKIIPEKGTTKVIMETENLMRAVRTASIFARESANIVRLKIGKSGVTVSANAPQLGDNMVGVEAKVEGEENKIAFNSRYLLDFLNVISAEQISLEMTSPLNPGIFAPLGDKSFLHIIMPVRVQE